MSLSSPITSLHENVMPKKNKKSQAKQPPADNLSQAKVAEAAVHLLDTRGTRGLTMRALAEHLGSGVMSLYWYVDNKDGVFDLALDFVMQYNPPASHDLDTIDCRAGVIAILQDWREVMLKHPWSVFLLPQRTLGPNILTRLEMLAKILSRAGVQDTALNTAIWSLWNYVVGATTTRVSFLIQMEKSPEPPVLDDSFTLISQSGLLMSDDWDGVFLGGLDMLLDGIIEDA